MTLRRRTTGAMERLIKIDQKLSNGNSIQREVLFNYLSSGIEKISIETLDKDIKKIKEYLEDTNEDVRLKYDKAKGYHYTDESFSLFKNEITEEDKSLLMLAGSLFNIFKESHLSEKFNTTIDKVLSDSLFWRSNKDVSSLKYLQIEAAKAHQSNKWIPLILDAISKNESIEILYKGYGKEQKKKHISPYILKQYQNRWFLVAYDYNCKRVEKTNNFSLDGILEINPSHQKYFIDYTFDINDYFKYSIGVWHIHNAKPIIVQLEINRNIEIVLANPIHHTQKIISYKKGEPLKIEIEVYNSPELETLILSFGDSCRVLSPQIVIDKIKQLTNSINSFYK